MSDVGEIVGRLRLDDSDWNAKLDQAEAKARELGATDPKIRVQAETGAAVAALTAVQAKVDSVAVAEKNLAAARTAHDRTTAQATLAEMRLDEVMGKRGRTDYQVAAAEEALRYALTRTSASGEKLLASTRALDEAQKAAARSATEEAVAEDVNAKAKTKSADAGKKAADSAKGQANAQGALIGALVAVSAAAPPVAAAAVGITGAFGVMGVAGILALTGISREMKTGQGEGAKYSGIVSALKGDLYSLQDSASRGLLPGVEQSVGYLQGQMPSLNFQMQHFGAELGAILPTGLDAVVTLLQRAEPLLDAGAGYLTRFVQGLDGFAHSDAYGNFIQYSIDNLPQVEAFLTEVLHTAGDFLAAWAPLGSVTLPLLTDLLTAVDNIVTHTGPLVPAAIAVAGAFSVWGAIQPIITGITGALGLMGDTAVVAGEKVAAAETVAEAAGGGGVKGIAGLLGKTGGLKGLGISAAGVLAGGLMVGNTDGSGSLNNDLLGIGGGAVAGASIGRYAGPIGAGVGALLGATVGSVYANRNNYAPASASTLNGISGSWNGYAPTTTSSGHGAVPTGMSGGDTSYGGFGATGAAAKAATAATQANTQADIANTAAMQTQKLAATQLATQYGVLDGSIKASTTAGYTNVTSFNAAQEAVLNVASALKKNKGAWSDNTAAGLADRDAVAAAVAAINAHAQAINADGKHSEQATEYTASHISSLVKEAEAAGISKGQITAYIAELLNIPKKEVTELLAEDKASAKANTAMQNAHRFSIGKYESILEANGVPADRATKLAMQAAQKWARTHAVATLDADTRRALAAARYAQGQIDAMTAHIQVTASVNNLGIAGGPRGNGTGYGGMAHGGTVTGSPWGPIHSAAYGTTVRGAGTAATDQAGLWRLANGEEVISDMWGGATAMRPFLKQVSAGNVKTKQQAAQALGLNTGPTHVVSRTFAPEIHVHNPVAQDPVQQAITAAQLALAYAGIG